MTSDSPADIHELQRQLALALDSGRMVAWTWDPTRDHVSTTGDLTAIYGLAAVEFAEKGYSLIHPEDVAAHRERVNAAIAARQPYHSEFRIIRPDNGQTVWIEERAAPTYAANGALQKLSGVVKDITDRKRAEAGLGEARTLLEQTFASLDQAVLVVEPNTRSIISANAAVERVFGYRPDELLQRSTQLFYADPDRYTAIGARQLAALDQHGAFHTEVEMLRKGGTAFMAEISVSEIRDGAGLRTGWVSVVRDITARRTAEAALQAAKVAAELAADRTALLQRVTSALTSILPAAEVAQIIAEQSAAALGASATAVYLLEADGQWLNMAGSTGYPAAVRQAVQRLPVAASLPGPDVLRSGEPLWLQSNEDLVSRYPALANTRSATRNEAVAVIPLTLDEHRQGVLALSFTEPQKFEQAERNLLLTLASQCAQALERTRLYVAEQRARQRAEEAADRLARLQRLTALLARASSAAEVAEVIIGQGPASFGTPSGAIFRLQRDTAELELIASHRVPAEVLEHYRHTPLSTQIPATEAASTGEPQFYASHAALVAAFPSLAAVRSPENQAHVSVPLLLGDELAGVAAISLREEHIFDEAEQEYLLALGRQAAQALERIQLYEGERDLHLAEVLAIEARFRALVNSVQDYAIFMLDPGGHVANWNSGAVRIKGYTADEIVGQHFSKFYSPGDREQGVPQRGLAAALRDGRYEAEGWRLRKDGQRFWANVVITPVYSETRELMGFAKVTRDLTERRQAEEQYRQSEHRLAEAQHLARLGSWYWDIPANSVTWSDEMFRIFGLKPGAIPVTYEVFLEFVHPDDRDRVHGGISQMLLDHQPFAFDHRFMRVDGTQRTLQARGEGVLDAEGQLVAISGTGQDITERKEIEDQLELSRERLRQLSAHVEVAREEERARMAREIHDELGGMLTGLKMDVVQMRRGSVGTEPRAAAKLEDFLGAIDQAVQTVRRIASDLRPAVLDDFGLLAAMEWQLGEFERRSGIACTWHSALKSINLPREDVTGVFRIFQESLTNVARHALATQVTVTVDGSEQQLVLQISDNGRGITQEQSQASQSLGLAGMRERVALLAGELVIEGSPGLGTTVLVKLPLSDDKD